MRNRGHPPVLSPFRSTNYRVMVITIMCISSNCVFTVQYMNFSIRASNNRHYYTTTVSCIVYPTDTNCKVLCIVNCSKMLISHVSYLTRIAIHLNGHRMAIKIFMVVYDLVILGTHIWSLIINRLILHDWFVNWLESQDRPLVV